MDEQTLSWLESSLSEQSIVGGREHLWNPARAHPVECVGHGHELTLVDDSQLGLATATDDPHHPRSLLEPHRAGPSGRDFPRQLQSRNVLRRAGGSGIPPAQLVDVCPVQAGRVDAHQHLPGAGLRVGVLVNVDLAIANRDRAHHSLSISATHSM